MNSIVSFQNLLPLTIKKIVEGLHEEMIILIVHTKIRIQITISK
jgi:hypothetical protein